MATKEELIRRAQELRSQKGSLDSNIDRDAIIQRAKQVRSGSNLNIDSASRASQIQKARELRSSSQGISSGTVMPKQKTAPIETIKGAGKFLLNLGKETVLSPVRFFGAAPAVFQESVKELTKNTKVGEALFPDQTTSTTPLSRFIFRVPEGATEEEIDDRRAIQLAESTLDGLLTLVTGGSGIAIKEGFKAGGKQGLKMIGKEVAKTAPIDFAAGSAYGALEGARQQEEGKDLLRTTLTGGVFGTLFPLGLMGVGAGAKQAGRLVGQFGDNILTKRITKWADSIGELEAQKEQVGKFSRDFGELERKIEKNKRWIEAAVGIQQLPTKAKRALIDKNDFLNTASALVKEKTGMDVDYRGLVARQRAKAAQRATSIIENDLKPIYDTFKGDVDLVFEYAKLKNLEDRLRLGQKVEGGRTQADIAKDLTALESEAVSRGYTLDGGPASIAGAQSEINRIFDDLLKDSVDAGTLKPELYDTFKKQYPNYVPNIVADFISDPTEWMKRQGGTSFTSTQSVFKKAKGSTRELASTEKSIVQAIMQRVKFNDDNRMVQRIIRDIADADLTDIPIKKVDTADVPKAVDLKKQGLESITVRKGGVEEKILVPKDLGDILKRMDPDTVIGMEKFLQNWFGRNILRRPTQFLKAVATQYNPFFIYRNTARDIQNAMLNSRMSLADWGQVFAAGVRLAVANKLGLNKSKKLEMMETLFEKGKKEGAFQSGLMNVEFATKELRRRAENPRNIFSRVIDSDIRPDRLIDEINSFMEQTTRRAVFFRTLADTDDLEFASRMAREATVDFSRAGWLVEDLNKIVPFLNARVQGVYSTVQAINRDPYQFMRRMMYTALYPTLMLDKINSQYESYYAIPEWERNSYWIIMLGEEKGRNAQGEQDLIPLYFKIPKGQSQAVLSSTIQRQLDIARGIDKPGTLKAMEDVVGMLNPLGGDTIGSSIFTLLPLAARFPLELISNYSGFKDAPIEPDYIYVPELKKSVPREGLPAKYRKKSSTSEIAKALGQANLLSPIQIDYVIQQGVLKDIIGGFDRFVGLFTDEVVNKKEKKPEENPLFKASEGAFTKEFFGSSSFGDDLKQKEEAAREERQQNVERIQRIRSLQTPR